MRTWMWLAIALGAAAVLGSATTAGAARASFSVATDGFYLSVGDYDYLPYVYDQNPHYAPPRISFVKMMGQYGRWVKIAPFGQCWQPYAASDWRPYLYGHWLYTSYGPYWEGYEPWAWVVYHYGSWIFDAQFGWVWVIGYDWYPSRVIWARTYDAIGWCPMPPDGYDYRDGRLVRISGMSQFGYSDADFASNLEPGWYLRGGAYFNPEARNMFYNPAYAGIETNLWIFINDSNFDQDDYADYDLGPDFTRYAFDEHSVRFTNRPIERSAMADIVRRPIQEAPVASHDLKTDRGNIRVIVPTGAEGAQLIQRRAPQVVQSVIAPAFAKEKHQFRGTSSKMQPHVSTVFKQENVKPRIEKRPSQQVINSANQVQANRQKTVTQNMQTTRQRVETAKREGRVIEYGQTPPPAALGNAPPGQPVQQHAFGQGQGEVRNRAQQPPQKQQAPKAPVQMQRRPPEQRPSEQGRAPQGKTEQGKTGQGGPQESHPRR